MVLEAAPSPGRRSPRPLHLLPRRRASGSRCAGPPAPRPPPGPARPRRPRRPRPSSPGPRRPPPAPAAARPSAPARRGPASCARDPREVSAPGPLGFGPGRRGRQCGHDSGCRPAGRGDRCTFSKAGSRTSPAAENSKSSLRIKAFVGSGGGEGLGSRSLSFQGPH